LLGSGIKYLAIVVVLLVFGSTILDTTVIIASAAKEGNYIMLFLVMVTGVLVLRFAGNKRGTKTENHAHFLMIATTIYLSFLIGLIIYLQSVALYFPIAGAAITGFGCKYVYESAGAEDGLSFKERISYLIASIRMSIDSSVVNAKNRGMWYNPINSLRAVEVTHTTIPSILQLMRDRPALPISLTHYSDLDFLIISNEDGWLRKILNIFSNLGIDHEQVSPLLQQTILSLPLIVPNIQYGLAKEEETVKKLIEGLPDGVTLFPHREGIRIIVPLENAVGFDLENLSRTSTLQLLVNRDRRAILQGGKEDGNYT
jgi:hypothetical protein